MGLLAFFLTLGLLVASVPSAQATALKPMTETEMSEVSGQAQSATIEKLAAVVNRRQVFKQLDGRLEKEEETNLGNRIMTEGLAEDRRFGSLLTMPVSMLSTQVMRPEVLVQPGAREVITNDAFLETMKIAGAFAKVFGNR